jgi:hypothetical protein
MSKDSSIDLSFKELNILRENFLTLCQMTLILSLPLTELFSLVLKNWWKWLIDHNCHYSWNDKLKCILIMTWAWLSLIGEYDFTMKHNSYVQYLFVVFPTSKLHFFISYPILFDRCQKGERYMWWDSNIGCDERVT